MQHILNDREYQKLLGTKKKQERLKELNKKNEELNKSFDDFVRKYVTLWRRYFNDNKSLPQLGFAALCGDCRAGEHCIVCSERDLCPSYGRYKMDEK